VFGLCGSFGNILMITLLQQWAPARLLGRIMSLIMLAAMGTFPASVAVAGVLIHHFGPEVFFPVAGIVLVVTVLAALTQRSIRDFGTVPAPEAAVPAPSAGDTAAPRPGPGPSA
jgi:MFS family permease